MKAYTDILEQGGPAFRTVFEFLRDDERNGRCLVHCTAGKDRTGVLCALVLGLCGVGDEDIGDEYALTEKGLEGWRKEIVEWLAREVPMGSREGAERMIGAR